MQLCKEGHFVRALALRDLVMRVSSVQIVQITPFTSHETNVSIDYTHCNSVSRHCEAE